MFNKIKELINQYKTLIINFFSLSILQGLNIILPFLTYPLIIEKTGVDGFGTITYATTIIIFFIMFIEFGFNTISTREISINIENKEIIQKTFNAVLTTKLFIFSISTFIFLILIFTVPKFRADKLIYFFSYIGTIGYVLFPLWLYHGFQKMKFVTYINLFYKIIFTGCIFLFLKSRDNLWIVPLFTSLGLIFSGITSFLLARRIFILKFNFCSFDEIKIQLKKSFHFFSSELYANLIAYTNILILGFFYGDFAVGVYSIAEKIIRAIASLLQPIINSLFPYISNLYKANRKLASHQISKIIKIGIIILFFTLSILFLYSDYFLHFIYKKSHNVNLFESILVFKMMILFPLFSFLDSTYGRLVLLTNGKEKKFFKVFSITFILGLIISLVLIYKFNYIGAAIANNIIQASIAFGMIYYAIPIIKRDKLL